MADWPRLMLDWERWTLTQSSGDAGVLALPLVLVATWASRVAAAVPVAVDVAVAVAVAVDLAVAVDVGVPVPDGDADGDGDCEACREGDGEVVLPALLLTLVAGDPVAE